MTTTMMKETPRGWPRIASAITCRDAAAHIDWLCKAFGFQVRLKVLGDDGRIRHSELTYGDGVVMVAQEEPADTPPRFGMRSAGPHTLGGNTQSLMVYVDAVEAHCATARAHGAVIASEPADHDYGPDYWCDRSYGAVDPEGHVWWFSQRVR